MVFGNGPDDENIRGGSVGNVPMKIIVSRVQTANSRAKMIGDGDGDDCDIQTCQPRDCYERD